MASEQHDFIVSLIVRKMRTIGFEVAYQDGRYQNAGVRSFEIPPKIIHHKPDVVGKKDNSLFCIGEAKTKRDLSTDRTTKQIIDFLTIVEIDIRNKLIIGIPLNASEDLSKLLRKLRVEDHRQLEIIYVPEALFPYEEDL